MGSSLTQHAVAAVPAGVGPERDTSTTAAAGAPAYGVARVVPSRAR